MWHEIDRIEVSDSGELSTELRVPAASFWFSGHFPGDPILPGIAQLGIVHETLRRVVGPDCRLAEVRRVKFRKIIRPDDELKIFISKKTGREGTYTFRIVADDGPACSGNFILEKGRRGPKT
jgi:3-hydroxymyristoyl/3-hydroxydecanoyl-(acyl carrier protein) dehydratase